jgi:nucleotide-binding universal stress UspA family protein
MRLSHIVVGVDFSSASELAARQALAIARRTGGSLTLLHVGAVPETPTGIPPSMEATARAYQHVLELRLADDRRRLDALVASLSGQGVAISRDVVDGFPDSAVADAAANMGADLLVVGTHGRTGIRRWLLGSVSEKTVRLAGSSVLVVRVPDNHVVTDGFHRIVVGVDFSEHADLALRAAIQLAAPGADVHAIHCWQQPGPELGVNEGDLAPFHAAIAPEMATYHEERGRQLLATFADSPVSLRFEAIQGTPAATLDDIAAREKADLIVVGSHGRRGVRLLLLGSVAEATVRHAPCSVLVVR